MYLNLLSKQRSQYITLSNGQTDHFYIDSLADPWDTPSDQRVILIQHGYGRTADVWSHWIPTLARKHIVIRRDLRGHGKSSFPQRINSWDESVGQYRNYEYNVTTITAEIVEFMDKLGINEVDFLGESTSGELAIALAALYPDRVRTIMICSSPTHLPAATCDFLAFGETSWPEAIVKLGTRGWAKALAGQSGTVPKISGGYLEWWMDEISKTPAEGMAGYADFLSRLDVRQYLEKVDRPTLILAPSNSKPVSLAESESMARQIRNSKRHIVEAPGHEIYMERPEECMGLIMKFLNEQVQT